MLGLAALLPALLLPASAHLQSYHENSAAARGAGHQCSGERDGTAAGACLRAKPPSASIDSVLLQARTTREFSLIRPVEQAAWAAKPFGDCVDACGTATRTRRVECVSLFGNSLVSDSMCDGMAKPSAVEACDCSASPCSKGACTASAAAVNSTAATAVSGPLFRLLGCMPQNALQAESQAADTSNEIASALDNTCIHWEGEGPCNGGLPFYRMQSNAMSASACFEFCISKGLDLFGITAIDECRCGASSPNQAVWHRRQPRGALVFPKAELRAGSTEDACPVRVYRYTGHYEDGGVPFAMMQTNIQDEAYIDSVVAGHEIAAEAEEDTTPVNRSVALVGSKREAKVARAAGWSSPGWARPCWPNDCGPGGGSWKKRRGTLLAGIVGRWEEYVIIEYYFDPLLDDTRKAAFRKAVETWGAVTCVHFVEAAAEPPAPALLVDALEPEACYATHIGYPGDNSYAIVNLGWCDSERYVGNIVHELGHVLGMNHEQKRPDAIHKYHGHGPHLVVHWQNVNEEWLDQYRQDPDSYMGSTNDGAGDPHSGYAPYDFGSIMHYPTGTHFHTIPVEMGSLTGNRQELSDGDILQILDQYQCRERGSSG